VCRGERQRETDRQTETGRRQQQGKMCHKT
jgi:hypothetical protein